MPLRASMHDHDLPALNLTSMIDVLFLVILFFMAGTRFSEMERQIDLEVPRVGALDPSAAPPQPKIVTVHRDGRIELDAQPVSLDELTQNLAAQRARSASLVVLVRGDGSGSFQRVAEVLAACKRAGISDLAISVTPGAVRRR